MLAVSFTATYLAAAYVLYTYLAPLLEQTMNYGRDGITWILLVFGAAAVIGNLAGGAIADRIGPFRTLLIPGSYTHRSLARAVRVAVHSRAR